MTTRESREIIENILYNFELINEISKYITRNVNEFGEKYRERARELLREHGYLTEIVND